MLPGFPPSASEAWQDRPLDELPAAVIDFETTGLHPNRGDEVIELAAVHVDGWRVVEPPCFNQLVNPGRPTTKAAFAVHHIPDEALRDKPPINDVLDAFLDCLNDRIIVGHNVAFDLSFLVKVLRETRRAPLDTPVLDTRWLSRLLFPKAGHHSLDAVARRLEIPPPQDRHRALGDARMTAHVFVALLKAYQARHPGARLKDVMADCNRLEASHYGSAEVLDELEKGARDRRVVEMVYALACNQPRRGGSPSPRKIRIYHLDPPYMVAYCLRRKAIRTFRTDRVISARCLEETYDLPGDFHPEDHFQRWSPRAGRPTS